MTLLNYIIYIVLYFLLQLLVEVNPQQTVSKPDLRDAHTATVIDDKLYILGGAIPPYINKAPPKETFLYIDCSAPFNTDKLEWIDLSNNSVIPPHYFAAAVKGGASNDTLFLYGGESLSGQQMSLVYTFNTLSNTWSIPTIAGTSPSGNVDINPIVNYDGLMYLYGGTTYGGTYTNDMFILDTINLSWKKNNSINTPSPRVDYGAVLLPDKSIMYIGGFNNNTGITTLNMVYLYDTINNIWTTQATGGLIPSARFAFSSVLGLDGQRVIIFGGIETNNGNNTLVAPEQSLYVLDLNNFNWNIPKTTGKTPSSRAQHRTVLIEKYMVVTFGSGYTQGTENDLLLLDISNNNEYTWTTNFVPTSPTSIGTLIGLVVGSAAGGILIFVGSFLLYKRCKKYKAQIVY